MKTTPILALAALLSGWAASDAPAATFVQTAGSTYVAFEADSGAATLIAGTPESWASTNDATASGGTTLFASGTNSTGTSPHSFAQYSIKFTAQGSYFLYYRWRADPARTGNDAFTANSAQIANTFGAFSTPGDLTPFHVSASNPPSSAPTDNVYSWTREADGTEYVVGATEVAGPVVFTLGTREAGMMIDRLVFSTEPALTSAQLDALVNTDTDQVIQDPGTTFTAFEADGVKATLIAGTPESWVSTNDATASGGTTLYASGTNSTGTSPHSFAQYSIKFAAQGSYFLYYRWRADPARTGNDAFTANSAQIANTFGAFSTPGDLTPFHVSASNPPSSAPTDNVYSWTREADGTEYIVGATEVAGPVVFTLGTREAGMMIDRLVFSTEPALTGPQLDALANSGVQAVAPQIKSAVASVALTTLTVSFTRPLASGTVAATNFTISGGVTVSAAALDPDDARFVNLTTSAQTPGTVYTLTVNNVTDTGGTAIAPNSTATFTAWKVVSGWALKEVYFGITGDTVADLTGAAKYPAKPDRVQWVKGFQLNQDPLTDNYGARLTTFFTPQTAGAYEFFIYNDNEAELSLSPNESAAGLVSIGLSPATPPPFADTPIGVSPALGSGQRYLLQGLLKQGTGDVYVDVAVRPQGSSTSPASLPILGGNQIATWVNPDLGVVKFDQPLSNVTTTAGSRAQFSARVTTTESPIYYQWRVNGTAIPGATLRTYVTPVLSVADSGKTYDLLVSVSGKDTASNTATLTVNPGQPSNIQPYLGINFVGGGTLGGASLGAVDVAGSVQQENWNNLTGFTFDQVPLLDAAAGTTPVTISTDPAPNAPIEVWYSGTKSLNDGDGFLLQGFLSANASLEPVNFRLNNVPAGTYNVLVYSMGFDFTANYFQAYSVTGAASYPTYHGKAETGLIYNSSPAFRRITTTTTNAPGGGNYVQFDNVSPAADGSLLISVTWEPPDPTINNTHQPAINAIQLAQVTAATPTPPSLTAKLGAAGTLSLSWSDLAAGFTLQSSATLAAGAAWAPVPGAPSPITAAGSINVSAAGSASQFYRLKKP
jgi:hypothetical protein